MAIPGFELPRVTLEQSYAPVPTSTVRTLSVVCVGPRYNLHRADVASEAAEISTSADYTASAGLVVASLPGHVAGGVPDNTDKSTQHLVVKDGVFSYATAQASAYDVDGSTITFSALVVKNGNGYSCSAAFGTRGVRVGDPLMIITSDGNIPAQVLNITSSEAGGKYDQIVVAPGFSTALSLATGVTFCEKTDAVFEQSADTFAFTGTSPDFGLTINGGLAIELDDLGSIEGTLQLGTFYIEYRERIGKGKNELGTLSSLSEIEDELGGVDKDNPLALACYFAMAGGGSNAVTYYTVVTEDTAAAYVAACDFLAKFNVLYSIVPCTGDETIIQQCMASCISYSNNINSKIRRALWYGIDLAASMTIWSGTGGNGNVSGTTVTLDDAVFIDHPLQEGDKLVYNDTQYAIVSTNGVNVATIGTSIAVPASSELSILRTEPTHADLIQQLIAARKACSTSERGVCVWADGIKFNGETVPNYAGAAAAAGMRASEPCQRPLSNLGYSFFTVEDTHGFTLGELEQIGAEGIWMIGSNSNGLAVNLRQVTTAASGNLLMDEESIISNADTIAINLSHMGEEYVGNSNITPELLDILRTLLGAYLSDCTVNYTGSILIGPQLLSWNIINIWQDPVNRDHVYAELEVEPPRPFNRFHIIMRVI